VVVESLLEPWTASFTARMWIKSGLDHEKGVTINKDGPVPVADNTTSTLARIGDKAHK